jgi:Ca-activated chloride channel family protein
MATIKSPRREATMVLALDVSNSMDAGDVKPSRIGAAKAAADTLVRQLPGGVRIGVVAFGPTALIVQPPTFDHTAVIQAVNRLSVGGGTSVAAGILTSLDAIAGRTLIISKASLSQDNSGEVDTGYYGGATIVLLSDGEDTSQTDPTTMARLASVAGVRVDTIGVGTQAGTTVEIDGFRVATALDQQTLEAVAAVTNGTYHPVDDQAGLRSISSAVSLHFAVVAEYTEVTAIFAAAAVLLLVAGAAISMMWFGRVV